MADLPDQEFVNALRAAVNAYLGAVDRWEAAYQKYYRMPGYAPTISSDMEAEHRDYQVQRRNLEAMAPRARRLCMRHRLRDPFFGLLRISLGTHAPQQRIDSAISRSERNAVAECLVQLADASRGWSPGGREEESDESPRGQGGASRRNVLVAAGLAVVAMGVAAGGWRALNGRKQPGTIIRPGRPNVRHPAGTSRFYWIKERPLTSWGYYGAILQHGMTARLRRAAGFLQLERAGPYMPPITFPGVEDVVLNSAGRRLLETSGLTGFRFQAVHKTRIVDLRWHDWDLTAAKPRELPASGEAEDYILERRPDSRIAEEMGDIWELVVPVTAKIGRAREKVDSVRELYLELGSWNGADIVRGNGFGSPLVTERARAWFEEFLGEYTAFEEFGSK